MSPHASWIGMALAFFGAIGFAGKAIIVKLAYRHDVDTITLLMLRMTFALPLFLVIAWWAGRGKPPLQRRDWLAVTGLGFSGYYLASFLDFAGLAYISVGLERLILYLSPTLVVVLGVLLLRRRVRRVELAALVLSYSGVLVVFADEFAKPQGGDAGLGAALVFASAFVYALYLLYSGEVVKRIGALRLSGLGTSIACLFCIAQFAFLRPLSALDVAPEVIRLSLLNATLCTVAPVVMLMMAVERIGPALAAQIGIVGPLSTILMGVVLLGEPFTASTALGTVLVMGGIGLLTRLR